MSLSTSIYATGLASFAVAVVLVLTKRWHGRFSMDDLQGVQKTHSIPTPRIGGVAIFVGVGLGWVVAVPSIAKILSVIILAGLPAFVFGLAEDLTKQVSVLARLIATMASGVLGWWITGYSLTAVDVPLLDSVLLWMPASVLFTALAVGGIANAVNIIDGFNGLASGFVMAALLALALIADLHGDVELAVTCLTVAAAMGGFWLVNWPWGKLFLGDGGSYFGGFAMAWASVLLIERNTEVSAFAALLICIHPVTEVMFSIYRRRLKKLHPGHPDRMHLHSLIMRRAVTHILLKLNGGNRSQMLAMRNPVTGVVLALMNLPSMLVAIWIADKSELAATACLMFALGYIIIYARLIRFRWIPH